ncbi:hypothetical protein SynA1528_01100 [Synechococcus sp. A15-28]|nr:hypothetical protein SynA1528_01100 [Synechococcus sp. A15-28]
MLLLPLITLLTACQSKREICAKWGAEQFKTYAEAAERLGIKLDPENEGRDDWYQINTFCSYYRSN